MTRPKDFGSTFADQCRAADATLNRDYSPPDGVSAGTAWGEPDWSVLDDRRGQLPEFPLDTLPLDCRQWIECAAHGAGVTPAHVATPLIGKLDRDRQAGGRIPIVYAANDVLGVDRRI
jgi:hypothetical protein